MNYSEMNEITPFDDSVPMLLYKALDHIMPAYRELFARHDLTEQQWRVLRVIWSSQNVTSAQLSERTLLSPPSLVSIIDRLENKGVVRRVRSATDRRAVFIVATSEGRALQESVMPQVTQIQNRIKSRLSDKQWALLEILLTTISSEPSSIPSNQTENA